MPKEPAKRLTDRGVRTARPGRHADGHGLHLVVKPSGARQWVQRITIRGKRVDLGLGPTWRVTLAEARQIALDNRHLVAGGGDPRLEAVQAVTFGRAAEEWHGGVKLAVEWG